MPAVTLAAEQGGSGGDLLLLLHGLGTGSAVWHPMLRSAGRCWDGAWLAPDLRGHGRSPWASSYALEDMAADIAALLLDRGLLGHRITLLGHSLGGVIALALAGGRFGFTPARCFGLGIKVSWTPQEAEAMRERAGAPVKYHETREAAAQRYLKASGLYGLIEPGDPFLDHGIAEDAAGWRLAADPRTGEVGPPPMAALVAAAACPVHLACGERDPMVSRDQLRLYDGGAEMLAGLGHNAMVEAPDAIWDWVARTGQGG